METRRHGDTETWRHGDMVTWRHGDMKTLRHGDMETCRHRDMEPRRHGDMVTWRHHGDMKTWRHGDMETWWHGDMKTWSMEAPNGKRKPRRFSLIHLPFAHRANGSLSSYPFANWLNALNGLVHLLDFNIRSVVNSKKNGATTLIFSISVRQQAHEAIESCRAKRATELLDLVRGCIGSAGQTGRGRPLANYRPCPLSLAYYRPCTLSLAHRRSCTLSLAHCRPCSYL